MIKLKNFEIKNSRISADIYPEDSVEKGRIELDRHTGKTISCILPEGYEWCTSHAAYARRYLESLIGHEKEIPKEKLIMWY